LNKDFISSYVFDLKPAEITWDTLQEGDEVMDCYGVKRIILGVCGKVFHLSYGEGRLKFYCNTTKQDLIEYDYTIVQPTPVTPEPTKMTVAEICKALGKTIEIVKE